jgi:hypothetical protein
MVEALNAEPPPTEEQLAAIDITPAKAERVRREAARNGELVRPIMESVPLWATPREIRRGLALLHGHPPREQAALLALIGWCIAESKTRPQLDNTILALLAESRRTHKEHQDVSNEIAEAERLRAQGLTLREIADKQGIQIDALKQRLKRRGSQ